jgi:hypothetical protein
MTKTKTITMPRDAITGQIVTKKYAETHPKTTTVEHRKVTVKTPPKKSGK